MRVSRLHLGCLIVGTVMIATTALAVAQDRVSPAQEGAAKAAAKAQDAATPTVTTLVEVRKIFIDKMANNLDQYVKAEIMKQLHGRLTIVTTAEDADGIMTGVSDQENGTGAKITGRYLGLHDVATGSVTILDRAGKTVLWVEEAGDRSLMFGAMKRGGQRKVADRLVHKLKKAMGV